MMFQSIRAIVFGVFVTSCFGTGLLVHAEDAASLTVGQTHITKWPDGKKACFMLAFDDGAPTQLEHVVPALIDRKIVGNFYLVTGNKLYEGLRAKWETAVQSPYVSIANHTFTHTGASDPETLDRELSKCNEVLYALLPDRKSPYLLGFGKPGGVPWTITDEELIAALAKHNLVYRPPFAGPTINYQTVDESIAVIDNALAQGNMGHLDFHGVGGDWLSTPLDWFHTILDKLDDHRDELWITDVVSWHQYERQRDGTRIDVVRTDPQEIRLQLALDLDLDLYHLPLTLITKVPSSWKSCTVQQDSERSTVEVKQGRIQYHAIPGPEVVIVGHVQ